MVVNGHGRHSTPQSPFAAVFTHHLACCLFATRIFELAPEAKSMFPSGNAKSNKFFDSVIFKTHAKALFRMVGAAVTMVAANNFEDLDKELQILGARHVEYGVTSDLYPIVGEALIHTLKMTLEDDFTNEVKRSWVKVYDIVVSGMEMGAVSQEFGMTLSSS